MLSPPFLIAELRSRPDRAESDRPDLPAFPAGEGFAYGDTSYVLAGLAIERATGRSPFDQIEERFLEPQELRGIVPARTRRIPGLAAGYQLPVNPFLLPAKTLEDGALRLPPMIESTAGGLAATPRDLVRWAAALFEGRALPGDYLEDLVGRSVATGEWFATERTARVPLTPTSAAPANNPAASKPTPGA